MEPLGIIMEYAPYGPLDKFLKKQGSIDWKLRIKIAIGNFFLCCNN